LRDGARGHTTRLQKNQRSVRKKRGRNARRLAGARLRGNDDCPGSPKVFDDLGNERVDRKRLVRD
jgi:hypothetical protein